MDTTFGYARASDGAYIGYRIDGDGPIDIVQQPEWPGNIDLEWEDPWTGSWLGGLAAMGRLIVHDHRGVGVSSRDLGLPTLETRVSDLMCVLEKIRTDRPMMLGYLSTGAVNVMAAATRPDLARALVWLEPMARYAWASDYPWGRRWEELDEELAQLASWGTEGYGRWFLEEEAAAGNVMPESMAHSIVKQGRSACTPDVARELSKIWYETDVRGVLPSVQVPTLLLVHEGRAEQVEQAHYIADLMPAAEVRVMPGTSWTVEEQHAWLDEIRRFIGQDLPAPPLDTVLATVAFTDIVGSTEKQAELGDRLWKELVLAHHSVVRDGLARWHGVENDTAGTASTPPSTDRHGDPLRERDHRSCARPRHPDPRGGPYGRVRADRREGRRPRRLDRSAGGSEGRSLGGHGLADGQGPGRRLGASRSRTPASTS